MGLGVWGEGRICNEGVGPRVVSQCLQAPAGITHNLKRGRREKRRKMNKMCFSKMMLFLSFFLSFFFFGLTACGILVPQPGTEPGPSAVKAQSPKHWTAREFQDYAS